MVTLYNGDCFEYMKSMPSKSIDAIITDPPYGIDYVSNMRKQKFEIMRDDDITNAAWLSFAVNIIKLSGAIYCCSRWDVLGLWKTIFEFFGMNVRNCIVWDKKQGGMGDLVGSYAPSHEMVLFATRGNHILRRNRPSDIIHIQRIGINRNHPTEKPVDLMKEFILNSTDEGGIVFDPFMGSGTTGVACVQLGRNFIGCEISPEYFAIAEKRIQQAEAQPSLFKPVVYPDSYQSRLFEGVESAAEQRFAPDLERRAETVGADN